MRSCSAGAASASNNPPASTAESSGRRRTRSTIAPQTRPSPLSRRSRLTRGTCSRSTRSPSFESNAGSTVSEPSIATATTIIVAYAKDANVASPVRNIPAIATITVGPEVEHRVVDADREPDQQHDRGRFLCEREQVTRERDQPERREDGRERKQQRNARGHERAERDHEDDQRQRDGVHARALEVVREGGVGLFGCARVAELSDEEAGMRALRLLDAVEDRPELVG